MFCKATQRSLSCQTRQGQNTFLLETTLAAAGLSQEVQSHRRHQEMKPWRQEAHHHLPPLHRKVDLFRKSVGLGPVPCRSVGLALRHRRRRMQSVRRHQMHQKTRQEVWPAPVQRQRQEKGGQICQRTMPGPLPLPAAPPTGPQLQQAAVHRPEG